MFDGLGCSIEYNYLFCSFTEDCAEGIGLDDPYHYINIVADECKKSGNPCEACRRDLELEYQYESPRSRG